ncbi:pitrilysin family protein [Nodosilinea sp. LEGE 07298]|uniref:M16 family metallopeptidase n=1 Tax=Nodosilinea sp. LEGE 07298 TaxID=2777970 RepID=UPI0028BD54C9|nr:pitrilysin family protein [Nodosilinea sp. LEGE 07298]
MTASLLQAPRLHRTVLANGLTVLVLENPVADIVSARLFIRAGSTFEAPHQAGLVSFLMGLLTKGTDTLSSMAIAETVESVGASLGTDAAADYSVISLKTVSADFANIFALAATVLRQPSFPLDEIDLERKLTLQQIRSMQEQPFTVAFNQLRRDMYGEHPYALPGIGTEATVGAITQQDLVDFHRQHMRPDNVVVTIVGRIAPEAALAQVEQTLGNWSAPATPPPALTLPTVTMTSTCSVVMQETNQAIVMVGYPAAAVKHPAYPALKLLNTYLGNGLSSRLFVELREKRGLAYDVSAFYPTRLELSQFVAYIGTAPENAATALDGLRFEVERLQTTVLSDEELQSAKNKLLGQYALGKQTNAQIAQLLGWYEILGLRVEYDQQFQDMVAAVTVLDAEAVAQEFFHTPCISLLGPEEFIAPVAAAQGMT